MAKRTSLLAGVGILIALGALAAPVQAQWGWGGAQLPWAPTSTG